MYQSNGEIFYDYPYQAGKENLSIIHGDDGLDKAYISMKKIRYDVIKKGRSNQRSYIRFLNILN